LDCVFHFSLTIKSKSIIRQGISADIIITVPFLIQNSNASVYFRQITFEQPEATTQPKLTESANTKLTLKALNNITTSGTLVLKHKDSEGYHPALDWGLKMDSETSGLVIILKNPGCTLTKSVGKE
jgi:hypothetical protein